MLLLGRYKDMSCESDLKVRCTLAIKALHLTFTNAQGQVQSGLHDARAWHPSCRQDGHEHGK